MLLYAVVIVSAVLGLSEGFATGMVSQACLQCICMAESGCTNLPCKMDVGSLSCGYFQIKHNYWLDCGSIGGSWQACAADKTCASQCVQNYMARYVNHYNCPHTCEAYAREHNGGPNGCHHSNTLSYWHHVQSQPGCSNVH
uniref:lysozyme n=1 Tax=Sinonovacula constricta TaxID=98310 RepID=A0A385XUB6_SINCO|nr:lysozyme 1 [Sinonovacula constricta]